MIERAAGALATASVSRMDEQLPWFRDLPADQRPGSCWSRRPACARSWSGCASAGGNQEVSDEIFDAAPRALARSISLQQTVQLIKITIEVVEDQVPRLAAAGEERAVADAMLRFSREVAFAAARVYARAAETRGLWDARLQALLVDSLLRGDSTDEVAGRAAALGWSDASPVSVAVGRSPAARPRPCCTRCTGWPGGWVWRCSAGCTATGWSSCSPGRSIRSPPRRSG